MVHVVRENSFFCLFDAWEDIWFSLIGSISTNSEKAFVWVLVGLERDINSDNWVEWGHCNITPLRVIVCGESADAEWS